MRVRGKLLWLFLPLAFLFVGPALAQAQRASSATQSPGRSPGLTLQPTRSVQFSTSEATWTSLDVSPDGKTILFDLLGHLYTMPIQGGEAKAITSGLSFERQPRFSHDGKQIVYISDRSGADNLWISNADGSHARLLTADPQTRFTSPIWTADDRYILVSRKMPYFHDSVYELWMYDVNGGSGIRVTKSKPTEDSPPESWHNALGPAISPGGRYVYYAVKHGYFSADIHFPLWQIARRDLQTGEEDVLTSARGSGIRPVLSPDGTKLVYGTRYDSDTALRIRDLPTGEDRWLKYPVQHDDQESLFPAGDLLPSYAFTPDGQDLILSYGGKIHRLNVASGRDSLIPFNANVSRELGPKLDFPARVDEGPVHARLIQGAVESPDGTRLAFSSLSHLYVMDLPNGTPRRLTSGHAREYEPAWSPDGRWLAYVTWENEEGAVWKIAFDGSSDTTRLSGVPSYYSDPVWSPDGSRIVAMRAPAAIAMEQADQWLRPISGRELVSIPASGGTATVIAYGAQYSFPHFSGAQPRLFVTKSYDKQLPYHQEHALVSMRLDGTDQRTHMVLKAKNLWGADFSTPVQLLASPDGAHAVALYRTQLYLFDLPQIGGEPATIDLNSPTVAVRRLTSMGADFAGWADVGKAITWSLGPSYFRLPFAQAESGIAETPHPDDVPSEGSVQANTPKAAKQLKPQEIRVSIEVPRHIPRGTVALTGAKIITMRGDEILASGDIVVHNNRIESIGPHGSVSIPRDATVVDVSGATIVPGFIDTHAHWFNIRRGVLDLQNWDFLATLAYGITTGRDPQTYTDDTFAYQDLVDSGEIIGPRAYSTGPGVFWGNDFQSEEEAEDVVRRYKDYYRTNMIKSYMIGNRSQREFTVEACEKLHVMPTTEGAGDLYLDLTHAIDGYSGNEHQLPTIPLYQDVVNLVGKSGISYTPTFIIAYDSPGSEEFYLETTDVYGDPKVRRFIPHDIIESRTTRMTWYRKDEYKYPLSAASAAAIMDAGGNVCVGGHGEFQGLSFHWQLWSLQSGGMSSLKALRAATLDGAKAIGLSQDLGSLEFGKLADLVILSKDPLQDIHNSTAIRYVMKDGELFDGNTLNEIAPEQKTFGPFWWSADHP
jgi:Tol biopolymer transport system component